MRYRGKKQSEPIKELTEMIKVQSDAKLIARYQTLLVSDWTKSLPQKVLTLLWDMVAANEPAGHDPILPVLDLNDASPFPSNDFQSIVAKIANGTKFVRLAKLPELSSDYHSSKRLTTTARQANRLATYLTLSAHTTLTGNREFFVDVSALAFQAAIHFLLPELRKKHEGEHSLLLHSAVLFAISYAAYEPAHFAYLMSLIHAYLGDQDNRLSSLFASFRFTPPQDHSYLTKAQEYWMELLDQNKHEEAERFLLSLQSWSSPSQQEEVREMVVEAFRYILKTTPSHA